MEKVSPAGWKQVTKDETKYFGEYGRFGCYCNDGVVFKDEVAFKTGEGVCYVNEYGFDVVDKRYVATTGYTRQDLIDLCHGNANLAAELFEHLDWMSPETLIDEWEREEELS